MDSRTISFASLLVITLIFGWKFGFVIFTLISITGIYVFVCSGAGAVKVPVQSVDVGAAKPKETAPRARIQNRNGIRTHRDGVTTLYENFQKGLSISPDLPCISHRPNPESKFVSETYKEVHQRILNFGSGLVHIGTGEPGTRIGFYAKNCREWFIGAEACNAYSLTSVAIYDTLGIENREYIVDQSETKAICATGSLLNQVCDLKSSGTGCPVLEYVILIGGINEEQRTLAKNAGLTAYSFEEVEKIGQENSHPVCPPKPEDVAILMYTSGTTSRPKGVVMTHANVVAGICGVLDSVVPVTPKDRFLSYLPLAHILERVAEGAIIQSGANVGYFQGDIRKLTDDILTLKPTIFAAVPKVLQRFMNVVNQKVSQGPKPVQILFNIAFVLKLKLLEMGLPTGFLDSTIFKKTHDALGGECRLIVSGGAPLGKEAQQFVRVCFGRISQGYALTETCGGGTLTCGSF